MSDTCIVCLGDLNASAPNLPLPSIPATEGDPPDLSDSATKPETRGIGKLPADSPASELIAHLLPCGHNLHDECLKPWVERANSCPICRQNFNQVELCEHINGPSISSYAVSDRTQTADIDPSMLIEELDDEFDLFPPCSRCGSDDNEDVLMACDGCDSSYHTFCVDLDSVPAGSWFCEACETVRAIEAVNQPRPSATTAARSHRTRGQAMQIRNRAQNNSSTWSRIWQTVFDRTEIDIDFPFNDNETATAYRQAQFNGGRRNNRFGNRGMGRRAQVEERLRIAERQGASSRFRAGVPELLDEDAPEPTSRPRPELPEPESIEEIVAWNAFEKARDIDADPAPKSRKRKSMTPSPSEPGSSRKRRRKSVTASPSEPPPLPQPERRLKRPQTRRAIPTARAPAPSTVDVYLVPRPRSSANGQAPEAATTSGPSFLQSLLTEVATSAIPDEPRIATANLATSEYSSPGYSSPCASPTSSNHPSPRAMSATPPPQRSLSPPPLTSKIEPLYPPAPDLSASDAPMLAQPQPRRRHPPSKSQTRIGQWAIQTAQSSSPTRARSEEASPTRANMSLSAKENVQRLVKEALRQPYQAKQVTKDQYTDINRNISRMLYDKIGEDGLHDGESNESWKKFAVDEVEKAVLSMRATN